MLLTIPSQLATVLLLLTGTTVEAQDLSTECCAKKVVGSVSYTLLPGNFHGELPSQCLSGCVYTVSGTSSPKFCFKKGDLPSGCFSDIPGTGCPEPESGAQLSPNGDNGAEVLEARYEPVQIFYEDGTSVEVVYISPSLEANLAVASKSYPPDAEDNAGDVTYCMGSSTVHEPIKDLDATEIFTADCVFLLTEEDATMPPCTNLHDTCVNITGVAHGDEDLGAVSSLASWNLKWCPRRVPTWNMDKLCDYPQCCFHPRVRIQTGLGVWSCLVTHTATTCGQSEAQHQLHFELGGETHTQEHVLNQETGILEVHVPPHANYTKSKYLVSEGHVLLNTNGSCQLSERPPSSIQVSNVLGLPLLSGFPGSSTNHMMKVRKTRVTHRKRQELMSAHKEECKDQAIVKTEDFGVSEEDYQKVQEGGFVTVKDDIRTRGCQEARQCTSVGPHARGYTGWTNPDTGVRFLIDQVSTGSICVTCKENVTGTSDLCNQTLCWCKDITDKETLLDCAFISNPVKNLEIENSTSITDSVQRNQNEDSGRSVFTQTTTYSGATFDERSIKIEVPPHRGSRSAFDQLTVVMHAARNGYWHHSSLQDNMLFKSGNQCLITTIPSDFNPVDGALGLKEIVDVVEEQDSLVKHSVLLDEGEMTADEVSSLGQPIKEECTPSSRTPPTIRRVTEAKVTEEQAAILDDGGVIFLPQKSSRSCPIKKALTVNITNGKNKGWYWPNPETEAYIALKIIIKQVMSLTCCVDTDEGVGPCCKVSHPDLCLCRNITTQIDFLRCKGDILSATCGGWMDVFIDGDQQRKTGSMHDWSKTSLFVIPKYTNVLAIGCIWTPGGPEGILASTMTGLKTDSSWKCSNEPGVDWFLPGLNPPGFTNANSNGTNGVAPWGERPGIRTDAEWIWPVGTSTYVAGCRLELL